MFLGFQILPEGIATTARFLCAELRKSQRDYLALNPAHNLVEAEAERACSGRRTAAQSLQRLSLQVVAPTDLSVPKRSGAPDDELGGVNVNHMENTV